MSPDRLLYLAMYPERWPRRWRRLYLLTLPAAVLAQCVIALAVTVYGLAYFPIRGIINMWRMP